jgi:hypothetical protein
MWASSARHSVTPTVAAVERMPAVSEKAWRRPSTLRAKMMAPLSDWPLILSIGANVGIAGIAYLGTRQQNDTARHAIDSEAIRADVARQEGHFQHRQSVYHEYLDIVRALTPIMAGPGVDLDSYAEWRDLYEHRLNAVVLFGTEAAKAAADRLHESLMAISRGDEGNDLATHQEVRDRFWSSTERIGQGWRGAVAAMREDIAPRI